MRLLYGENLERIDDRNYTLFFKYEGWDLGSGQNRDMRYFGLAPIPDVTPNDIDRRTRAFALELPSPGDLYDTAFSMIYAAAVHKLGLDKSTAVDSTTAMELLAARGFRVLSLDDFMKL